MKAKQKSHSSGHKSYDKGTTHTSFSQNNIGTLGHVSIKHDEGKGSFKKVSELVNKSRKPNVEGLGENEENHSTRF
ncbi:hypothetical protein [Daejeonella oryzae]|uniref:hypothetical protein n=1 Tax=Daejeonella oryzae TaxID=1122943 RepID=UPI00041BF162|nr:hypothetical protein [Daejeonella oryzae]